MPLSSLPPCPFMAGPMITDPRLFVGRSRLLIQLAGMMQLATSANIIGERRIGKSSLLYNFCQTWEQRVSDPSKYCVVYLNLQAAQCDREQRFYHSVLQALGERQRSVPVPNPQTLDRLSFAETIRQWKRAGVLPVLCLDEFESLFNNTREFNDGFFDNLRSLMTDSTLMLILASHKSVDFYKKKHRLTSDFFNGGHIIKLEDLAPNEVNDLVRLPASTDTTSRLPVALGLAEQNKAKDWGQRHPCKLQHAANALWHAGQHGYSEAWARQQFLREAKRVPRRWARPNPIRAITNLGRLTREIGNGLDNFGNTVTGIVVVVLVLLTLVGVLRWEEVKAFLNSLGG